jgi:hypothetical protein
MKIIGYRKPQEALGWRATKTAGGLTTWIEFFSLGGDHGGKVSLIQGDTKEIIEWAEELLRELKEDNKG